MTVYELQKRVKNLREDLSLLTSKERTNRSYEYAAGSKKNVPDYSLEDYQNNFLGIATEIMVIKHKINMFNTTHEITVAGITMTIDAALVYISMMNQRADTLKSMAEVPQKKSRITSTGVEIIDETSYNPDDARKEYERIRDIVREIQLKIDTANMEDIG